MSACWKETRCIQSEQLLQVNWLLNIEQAPGAPANAVESLSQVLNGRHCRIAGEMLKRLLHPQEQHRLKLRGLTLQFLSR